MASLQFLVLFSIISSSLFGAAVSYDFIVIDPRGYNYNIIYDGILRAVTTRISGNTQPLLITHVHKVLPYAFKNLAPSRLLISTKEKNFELVPESFNGLLKLKDLTLLNGVTTLKPRLFQSIPSITNLFIKIDGSKQNFSYAFPGLSHLERLTVSQSNLSYVNSNTFFKMVPPINYLKLQESNIYMLEKNAFATLKELKFLEVILNPPLFLESGCFNGLDKLEVLDLTFNNMVSISNNIFNNIKNLRRLNLANNKIQQIEVGSFSGMDKLTELILDNNNLTSLEEGIFDGLPEIEKLSLVNCKIELINGSVFNEVNVIELSLNKNNLKAIHYGDFQFFPRLDRLYLMQNQINQIESAAFMGLRLARLDLSNNNITEISADILLGTMINHLVFSNNHITHIENGTFIGTPIGNLYLDNNPVADDEIYLNNYKNWAVTPFTTVHRH